MSEESLRRFLARLTEDGAFLESVRQDPQHAFEEFELSPAERVALATNDEDALRRLSGADVAAFGISLADCLNSVLSPFQLTCQCQSPVAVPATKGADCARPASIGIRCAREP